MIFECLASRHPFELSAMAKIPFSNAFLGASNLLECTSLQSEGPGSGVGLAGYEKIK